MKILVCVKQVPDTPEGKLREDYTLAREFVAQVMNPADESALEKGLALRDAYGGNVTVVTMGPKHAEGMLREALSRGADEAVLLSDPAFAGADTLATARALQSAFGSLGGFELVLCGRRAVDGETGQVGAMLSSLMDFPCVTNATDLRVEGAADADSGAPQTLLVDQLTEEGVQVWRCHLPAVITLCEWSHRLRLPSLAGMRRAAKTDIRRFTPADLGLPTALCGLKGSLTRVIRVCASPWGVRPCEKLDVEAFLQKGVLP